MPASSSPAARGRVTPALVRAATVVPLTDREREIAVLAAAGQSSRLIAERLFLSVRTVDNHLGRIYDKLGVSSRADLAAALEPETERASDDTGAARARAHRRTRRCGDAAPAMAVDFYRRLFAADPSAEALFTTGPDVMSVKFADELDAIVEAITSFDTFAPRVRELAARHVGYGVQTHHYHAVGEALIGALAAHLGEGWDEELEAAWRRAYNLVAEMMMAAAAESSDAPRWAPCPCASHRRVSDGGRLAAWRTPAPCRSASPGDDAPRRHPGVVDLRRERARRDPARASTASAAPTTSKCSGCTP